MGRAEDYRKRAKALDRAKKGRIKAHQKPVAHKQKGLRDMADNEDWLDGKPGTGIFPDDKK